jgi:hypothetical protein
MTDDEAVALLAQLLAAFGGNDVARPTIDFWIGRIAQEDYQVGAAAVAEVIETWRWPRFPAIAAFAEAAAERRAALVERGHRQAALESPAADPVELRAHVADMRTALAAAKPPRPKPQPAHVPRVPLPMSDDGVAAVINELDPTVPGQESTS